MKIPYNVFIGLEWDTGLVEYRFGFGFCHSCGKKEVFMFTFYFGTKDKSFHLYKKK